MRRMWDIPELKAMSLQQRRALFMRARQRDKRIWIRPILANLIFVPLLISLMKLHTHGYLPSFLLVVVLYLAIGFPLASLLYRWWVDPLAKSAIQALLAEDRENKSPREAMH